MTRKENGMADLKLASGIPVHAEPRSTRVKTILVTGGAGYVGSILVRRLLQNQYRVVCIDNLRFGGSALLDIWDHPYFTFKKVDITDHAQVARIIDDSRNCHGIVHLAAIVGDPACRLEPELTRKTNLDASIHLLEQAKKARIQRFVFASTCSNYGKMKEPGGFVDEDSVLAPVSLYAELKVEVENTILNAMEKTETFCPTCLRFATVYGISPRMRFDLTVNEFTKELALDRELVVFGEQFWRPYCYVGDFSKAILTVLNAPKHKVAYNVFNVGSTNQNYTKKMIIDELLRLIPTAKIKYVRKDEDPRDYRVKFDKIGNELGFVTSKTVPEGMEEILRIIRLGIIDDLDNQRFYNIPIGD
jgi:nucleoside-diphosphate-sugar epimerase